MGSRPALAGDRRLHRGLTALRGRGEDPDRHVQVRIFPGVSFWAAAARSWVKRGCGAMRWGVREEAAAARLKRAAALPRTRVPRRSAARGRAVVTLHVATISKFKHAFTHYSGARHTKRTQAHTHTRAHECTHTLSCNHTHTLAHPARSLARSLTRLLAHSPAPGRTRMGSSTTTSTST
jgi:hypothetical protein